MSELIKDNVTYTEEIDGFKFIVHQYAYSIWRRCIVTFDNGYGASIIKNTRIDDPTKFWSYGTPEAPYEIGYLKNDTLFTPDGYPDEVKGYLTMEEVKKELEIIKSWQPCIKPLLAEG